MYSILDVLIPILTLIGALIIFQTFIKKSTRKYEQKKKNFIETERQASFSRAKDVEEERYIKPDIGKFELMNETEINTTEEIHAYELQQSLIENAKKTMAHFKETNIELKQMYGIGNLEIIVQWEENYTQFLHKLNSFAKALKEADRKNDAIKVLEEGIKLGLDFTQSFILLADLYKETEDKNNLQILYQLTKQNKNINMNKVVTHIEKLL